MHSLSSKKELISQAGCVLYLVLVALFSIRTVTIMSTLRSFEPWGSLYIFWNEQWLLFGGALLCAVLVMDAFANRISLCKIVIAIIGFFLMERLSAAGYVFYDFVFFYWFVVAYPRSLRLKTVVAVVFIAGTLMVIFTISASLLGLVTNTDTFEHGMLRRSLGFELPNRFSIIVSALVMTWVYLKSDSWNWQRACVASAVLILAYAVGDGRIALVIGLAQVLITSFFSSKRIPSIKEVASKAVFKLAIVLPPVAALSTLVAMPLLSSLNGSEAMTALNSMLAGRPASWVYHYDLIGFHPFIDFPFEYTRPCDNTFLFITLTIGIVGLLYIVSLYVLAGWHAERSGDLPMAIFILLLTIHALSEIFAYKMVDNIAIYAIGAAVATCSLSRKQSANSRERRC